MVEQILCRHATRKGDESHSSMREDGEQRLSARQAMRPNRPRGKAIIHTHPRGKTVNGSFPRDGQYSSVGYQMISYDSMRLENRLPRGPVLSCHIKGFF